MIERKKDRRPNTIGRRDFLKLLGLSGAALATSCAPEAPDLIPYVWPPENIVPGKAIYFATTCRECPAGCGVLAKNVDGRIVKLEGNPQHPINQGRLCPRGQAALNGLYNPDRLRQPVIRKNGKRHPLQWEEAYAILKGDLNRLRSDRRGRIAFITPLITGTLKEVIAQGLKRSGAGPQAHIMYEALAYEALTTTNQVVFGRSELPTYRIDEADLLISLGADFLETWLSTVEYARRFARFHQPGGATKNFFVHVGSRRSLTAANADHILDVAPGREYLVGLAILKIALAGRRGDAFSEGGRNRLSDIVAPFELHNLAAQSGVGEDELHRVAQRFVEARRPLVLAGGNRLLMPSADAAAFAAAVLCTLHKESLALIDFDQPHALGEAATAARMLDFTEQLRHKEIDLLLIYGTNPVFTLPAAWRFEQALQQVPTVVSFSSYPDETSRYAHLCLPAHTFLESWGEYEPRRGLHALMQPTMGPVFDTRPLTEIVATTLFQIPPAEIPAGPEVVQAAWRNLRLREDSQESFTAFWVQSLRSGGHWPEQKSAVRAAVPVFERLDATALNAIPPVASDGDFDCMVYPTIQFYDGRAANRPWLQELPDPITQVTWSGWVEMHPDDARRLDLNKHDLVEIASPAGKVNVPVLPIYSVPPGRVALPIGQGHIHFGRFAEALPANPIRLLPVGADDKGRIAAQAFRVSISAQAQTFPIANTDGSFFQHGRDLVQTEPYDTYREKAAARHKPGITPPLPAGYLPEIDFYPPHQHGDYRWAMVVDLDRCIGCSACVVACYAENNVACVGREQMLRMREMSWIRVQRYFTADTSKIDWLVMLCQHCDSAPCESVCPVFAPQHNPEGLNNQVYNRCFGTRFCSQNCPYKVRRFNWYTWSRAGPLNMQLNPDVTVRQKGIMEKCSFCIQRIVAAKVEARNQGRLIRDGEFTTACAQTCPTEAIVFGNLLDPRSRVSGLIEDARAYQVFQHLNTKPAVIYLKKLTQQL
jgi:anaerobic selenocysteine-containing dehydrogenase/Fe-S-cluster-containing dehydrogenase component